MNNNLEQRIGQFKEVAYANLANRYGSPEQRISKLKEAVYHSSPQKRLTFNIEKDGGPVIRKYFQKDVISFSDLKNKKFLNDIEMDENSIDLIIRVLKSRCKEDKININDLIEIINESVDFSDIFEFLNNGSYPDLNLKEIYDFCITYDLPFYDQKNIENEIKKKNPKNKDDLLKELESLKELSKISEKIKNF